MIIPTLGYCSKDCEAALKFVNWCAFMSRENGYNLKNESILLLVSKSASGRRRHLEIVQSCIESWGHVYVHINPFEDEKGWPSSPNTMFYSALTHVEEHFGADMLWLEPDGIPLCEDWLDALKDEWATAREQGKTFAGSFVLHYRNHLTGISIYGHDWRKVAPSLADIVENGVGIHEAWDTHAANEIMPHAYFTNRIQHIFYTPLISGLDILKPEAVIFHQDKQSKLIAFLDEELYGGRAGADPRWSYLGIEQAIMDIRFFHSANSNRPIKSQGLVFNFEGYEVFAGAWRGTYATQDEREIVALEAMVQNARSGITEIDKATYEEKSKKKAIASPLYEPLKPAYQARINTSPAEVVVVDNPSPSPDAQDPSLLPERIEDVIKIGKVEPATTHETPPDKKRPNQLQRARKILRDKEEAAK